MYNMKQTSLKRKNNSYTIFEFVVDCGCSGIYLCKYIKCSDAKRKKKVFIKGVYHTKYLPSPLRKNNFQF